MHKQLNMLLFIHFNFTCNIKNHKPEPVRKLCTHTRTCTHGLEPLTVPIPMTHWHVGPVPVSIPIPMVSYSTRTQTHGLVPVPIPMGSYLYPYPYPYPWSRTCTRTLTRTQRHINTTNKMSKKIIIMFFWCVTQFLTLFCTCCGGKMGEKLENEIWQKNWIIIIMNILIYIERDKSTYFVLSFYFLWPWEQLYSCFPHIPFYMFFFSNFH